MTGKDIAFKDVPPLPDDAIGYRNTGAFGIKWIVYDVGDCAVEI